MYVYVNVNVNVYVYVHDEVYWCMSMCDVHAHVSAQVNLNLYPCPHGGSPALSPLR